MYDFDSFPLAAEIFDHQSTVTAVGERFATEEATTLQ